MTLDPAEIGTGAAFSEARFFDPEVANYLGHSRRLTPQEELMVAVLERAVEDLTQHSDPRLKAEAFWYIASRDRDWNYSFENLCEHFRMEPKSVRKRLGIDQGLEPVLERTYPEPFRIKGRILTLLREERAPLRLHALHRKLGGGDVSYIDAKLREMVNEGTVERVSYGVYRAAA